MELTHAINFLSDRSSLADDRVCYGQVKKLRWDDDDSIVKHKLATMAVREKPSTSTARIVEARARPPRGLCWAESAPDSKPQEVTSRAIQCDPAFLPHSPQQVKQAFIAAGGGEAGLEAAISLGAVIQLAPPVQLPPTCPPLEVLMSNFDEEGEQGNTQGAVQDTSIDDGDESGTEDQPMFDDIPDASMQQLLGTGTTNPEDDATNPLIAHGLKWTLEECISMDVCRDQPKNTIINFPNGVVPDFGNFYSIWKLLFTYDIMPDCVQNISLLLEKGGLPPTT
ncbi:hypothetical protein EMCRGX_G031378 [Ephydatia muelleri]